MFKEEGVKGFFKGYLAYIMVMSLWILTVPYVANFLAFDAPWQPK
jgi:hypothetical protein